LSLYK